jgi:hypothetical protein
MLRASGRARRSFFELAGMQDKQKSPPAKAAGPSVLPMQNGASCEAGSGADACAGTSARARRNRHAELVRALEQNAKFAAFAFLRLAVLALVLRAEKLSVNKDMVVLVERVCEELAEAVDRICYVEKFIR